MKRVVVSVVEETVSFRGYTKPSLLWSLGIGSSDIIPACRALDVPVVRRGLQAQALESLKYGCVAYAFFTPTLTRVRITSTVDSQFCHSRRPGWI